jgi:hypothetical protein
MEQDEGKQTGQPVENWGLVETFFLDLVGKLPDLDGMFFLIGLQELGKGLGSYSKEEKQDIIQIGTCAVLLPQGFYNDIGRDADGWPKYELLMPLPVLALEEQEHFLKESMVKYIANL